MTSELELRFECTKCGNCCSDTKTLVNMTYHDILRIKKGLNLTIDELIEIIGFYVFESEPSRGALKKMVIPPIKTEKGLSFIGLRKKDTGKCYFYDEENKKCLIYLLRPNFCITFPFSFRTIYNKQERKKKKLEIYYTTKGLQFCPGIKQTAPLIEKNEWIELGKITIKNLIENNVLIEKWNDAVTKGKIKPSAKNFILTVLNLEN